MPQFYVSKKPQFDGYHEVHESGCTYGALPDDRSDLGWHLTCHDAVIKARDMFPKVDGCAFCCPGCHTR